MQRSGACKQNINKRNSYTIRFSCSAFNINILYSSNPMLVYVHNICRVTTQLSISYWNRFLFKNKKNKKSWVAPWQKKKSRESVDTLITQKTAAFAEGWKHPQVYYRSIIDLSLMLTRVPTSGHGGSAKRLLRDYVPTLSTFFKSCWTSKFEQRKLCSRHYGQHEKLSFSLKIENTGWLS